MRKRIILSLISIFAFVFFSCSGLLSDVDENSSSNKAYVQIGDTSSRTVLPNALTTDDMTNIKLIGVKDGVSSELLSANTYSELSGKTKEIEAGTWSFSLSATINGNTFTDSTSCKDMEVSTGQTLNLTFSAMETSATTGDFRVTVNYVGTADDEVYVALDGVTLSSTEYTVDVENNVVTVSKSNVEAGDYLLSIQFSKNNVVVNTFDEIVSVEGGCTSEAEYEITLNKSPSELLEQQSNKIRNALSELNLIGATAFKPAPRAPADGITTYTLDEDVRAVAWNDGGIIYYYNPSSTTKISLGSTAYRLFSNCIGITEIDMSGFDTSNVTDMSLMFYECSSLRSLNVSNFNTSKVTKMSDMFNECSALTSLDLSNFDTSNVEAMARMFRGCTALMTIYTASNADWSSVSENSDDMFEDCIDLRGGKGTTFDSSYVNATYARVDSSNNHGYFTGVYTITDALKAGVELTITLNTTNGTSTVKFTRLASGSYSYTGDGNLPVDVHTSEEGGIINIELSWDEELYVLTINTNESTYTEYIDGSPVLQTIAVEGTDVLADLDKSN